jgi:large subunit ribosomal protein L27e
VFGLLVAGIERYPRKITKKTTKAKATKRSKIKPFVKCVNFNHMMPTRYGVDFDLKKVIGDELKSTEKRLAARQKVKEVFEGRYLNQTEAKSEKKAGGVTYFFRKLRF